MEINQTEVKKFYNELDQIWSKEDLWHMYSYNVIKKYISKQKYNPSSYILNAGSGGNDYGLKNKMQHVDIADEKIKDCPLHTVSSIEKMPFSNKEFDEIICVGSVINYCNASEVISEFARVLKKGGKLVLEFESSYGFEYKKKECYKKHATIVSVIFRGQQHIQWLYSPKLILSLLKNANFKIKKKKYFHVFTSYKLFKSKDENYAIQFKKRDKFLSKIYPINRHANNIILTCIEK